VSLPSTDETLNIFSRTAEGTPLHIAVCHPGMLQRNTPSHFPLLRQTGQLKKDTFWLVDSKPPIQTMQL